jgi:5-methylcytosine-specific restriction endonuclease McrA
MRKYDKEWLIELCKNSYSYAEVLRKAGRQQGGGTQATLKKKIEEYGIDISHFTGQRWQESPNQQNNTISRESYSLDEVFIENSPVTQKVLRGYIERHNILEYKCQTCGCDGNWQNGIIALEVDHINGDNTDNRIENLRYLCPNCHALTETYRGRNKALKFECREHTPTT